MHPPLNPAHPLPFNVFVSTPLFSIPHPVYGNLGNSPHPYAENLPPALIRHTNFLAHTHRSFLDNLE